MSASFLLGVTVGFIALIVLLSLCVLITSTDRAEQKKRREKYEDETLEIMRRNSAFQERQAVALERSSFVSAYQSKK